MIFALPYFESKTIYLFGSPVAFWVFTLWTSRILLFAVAFWEAKRLKLDLKTVLIITIMTIVFNQFFEKILFLGSHILLHRDMENFSIWNWGELGRIYFGGLIGSFLAVYIGTFFSGKKEQLGKFLDVFFLAHIFSLIAYRVGNVFHHSHIGKLTDSFLGMTYFGEVRFEPSIYEVVILVFFLFFILFLRRRMIVPGTQFLFIVSSISLMRFFLDFLRSDDLPESNFHFQNGISFNQIVYLLLFILCYAIFILKLRKKSDINH